MDNFPRKLKDIEKDLLFFILPSAKPGYHLYRQKINNMNVLGYGRFGDTNLILGFNDDVINVQDASSSVFAAGSIIYENEKIDISINEEIDDRIEFDISPNGYEEFYSLQIIKKWNYSDWMPGQKSPRENSEVREIIIVPNKYIFAAASKEKKLWLYEFESGINYLIPLSNFYNQLMIQKNIRDPKVALKPNLFFESGLGSIEKYSDDDLRNAFITYNKYLRRLNIKEEIVFSKTKIKKRKFFNFLTKEKF
jgi:hypothetical protein